MPLILKNTVEHLHVRGQNKIKERQAIVQHLGQIGSMEVFGKKIALRHTKHELFMLCPKCNKQTRKLFAPDHVCFKCSKRTYRGKKTVEEKAMAMMQKTMLASGKRRKELYQQTLKLMEKTRFKLKKYA